MKRNKKRMRKEKTAGSPLKASRVFLLTDCLLTYYLKLNSIPNCAHLLGLGESDRSQ